MRAAFDTVADLFLRGLALVLAVFAAIEGALRGALARAGAPHDVQTVILVAVALLLFVVGFKVLGGFLRILLILFLALLVVQLIGPVGGKQQQPRRTEAPAASVAAA